MQYPAVISVLMYFYHSGFLLSGCFVAGNADEPYHTRGIFPSCHGPIREKKCSLVHLCQGNNDSRIY